MIKNSSLILRLVPKGLARKPLNNELSTAKLIFKAASGPIDPIQQLYADKVNSLECNEKFPNCIIAKYYEKNNRIITFLNLFRLYNMDQRKKRLQQYLLMGLKKMRNC